MMISAARDGNVYGERVGTSPKCFLHIPKSGGVSIHMALEAALAPGSLALERFDTSVFCDFKDFDLLCPDIRSGIVVTEDEVKSLGNYRAVSGHFSLPTLLQVTEVSSVAVVLREPRTRLLSLYSYWRTPAIFERWTPYRADRYALRPLEQFLSEPRLAPMIDNQMCRMLLHGDSRLPPSGFAAETDIEGLAADAADRLDELGFVGILELRNTVWEGMSRLFGVKLDPIQVNVTGETNSPKTLSSIFTASAFHLIEQRGAADMLVYEKTLTRLGLDTREYGQVRDGAFAHQLGKLGYLVGIP
jgi:hypothetical protein